jgi:hypothetical protein
LLPEAVSEALGISLAEVLNLYLGELDEGIRDRMVWDAIDRRRDQEEGEEWVAGEARRRSLILERIHHNREDDSF